MNMFMTTLSDTPNLDKCASANQEDLIIPESYDFREAYPDCVSAPFDTLIDECPSSAYVMATISSAEDRICMATKEHKHLSVEEFLECDTTAKGCKGGDVTKVLNYGKRKGFIEESCYPEPNGTCPEDHFETNQCRTEKNLYRVVDHCLAEGIEGVKREILKNGPVLAMIVPNTDFLTYSDGVYLRSQDAFKFQGYHIVKVIGWTNIKESDVWLIQNTWGPEWGQGGYGKIAAGESLIDNFAIGYAMVPIPQAQLEQYRRQQEAQKAMEDYQKQTGEWEQQEEAIVEEGVDVDL
jgi:C1A family cysteine protease